MSIQQLMTHHFQNGKVEWIGIRTKRRQPMTSVSEVIALPGKGLAGDHYLAKDGKRQVTIVQKEHLDAVGSFLGIGTPDPSRVRRNIVISGINLSSLKGLDFKIGEALLRYTGECHPCSRMEENLGVGGYNAMRGHGGITAVVVKEGLTKIGDPLVPIVT
ncbi:MAG: MOSC domain-containing protein [Cytophagales bacterium]|nr:MOSC domain-containing protein [Cytophagales bacterium]